MVEQLAIDKIAAEHPNRYALTPENIKDLQVVRMDLLKGRFWFNTALNPPRWCRLVGCGTNGHYDDYDEFWIGVAEDGSIDCYFSSDWGMTSWKFSEFYKQEEIENKFDLQMQANTLDLLNDLIDRGILAK